MIWLFKFLFGRLETLPPPEPDPPPWDVPLDQTTAPIHFEGEVGSL